MTGSLHAASTPLLAWVPFLQPLPQLGQWWWLLIVPLVFAVSMVWKAVRLPTLERYWLTVLIMTIQVLAAMAALGLSLLLLVRVILPRLPVE